MGRFKQTKAKLQCIRCPQVRTTLGGNSSPLCRDCRETMPRDEIRYWSAA